MFEVIPFHKRFIPSERFDAPSAELSACGVQVAISYAGMRLAQICLCWGGEEGESLTLLDPDVVGVVERQKALIGEVLGWHISQLAAEVARGVWSPQTPPPDASPEDREWILQDNEAWHSILDSYDLTAEQYHQALCQALELLRNEETRNHDHA